MSKITPRRMHIIDRLKRGAILCTGTNHVVLSTPSAIGNEPDENIQLALFQNMVNDNIIYQELSPPFDFKLNENL